MMVSSSLSTARRSLVFVAALLAWLSVGCSSSNDSSSSGANKCPSGPGKCSDGDSSTCRCGESCVQTATCAGCGYECVKGCDTDADCEGYFSGDTPPAQLVCIGASSTMPTAHCGIGSSSSSGGGTSGGGGGGSTAPSCSKYASYDHFCTAANHQPSFEQCSGSDVPDPGCEVATDLQGISCPQNDCYCCP